MNNNLPEYETKSVPHELLRGSYEKAKDESGDLILRRKQEEKPDE